MGGDRPREGDRRSGASSGDGAPDHGRRRFLALAGTAATLGAAGCRDGGDGTPTHLTPPTDDDVVTVMTNGLPMVHDFGPSLDDPAGLAHLEGFLQALVLPVDVPTGEYLTSGHSWSVDGREVAVPCAVEAVAFDGNDAVRLTFDDRLTYWNGESLDARAYYLRDRVDWLANGHGFGEGSFDHELVSATEYRRSLATVAANRFQARTDVHPGMPPLPPSFTEPWIERFESASTVRTVQDRAIEYRQGIVRLETFAEEGYGSGAYEVEGPGDVRREVVDVPGVRVNKPVVYASPRSEYPGSPAVERLRILGNVGTGPVAGGGGGGDVALWGIAGGGGSAAQSSGVRGSLSDPQAVLKQGGASAGVGVVGPDGAEFHPESIPDAVEQLATYPNPARPATGLVFNWENAHLRRLWVRRALVAALPLDRIVANVGGRSARSPATWTGMLPRVDERVFDDEFLASLHEYPVESDTETAAGWLREAGYERPDERWIGPDGEELGFVVLASGQRNLTVAGTLENALESFGVAVQRNDVRRTFYQERAVNGEFDVAVGRFPAGWSPSSVYGDWFDGSGRWRAPSPVTVFGNPLSSCREGDSKASTPGTVTLPAEPGALRIDGVDYPDGGTTYRWSGTDGGVAGGVDLSVCEAARGLRSGDVDRETYERAARICARWYNYAVPNVLVAHDRVGLWADAEQLTVPPPDHPSLRVSRAAPVAPEHYHLQAGTLRVDVD